MRKSCARCGEQTNPTIDNVLETSFFGMIETKVETHTTRTSRLRCAYIRQSPKHGSPVLVSDEEKVLCDDCWGLLVGRFLQGRDVPALPGKEARR